MDLLYPRIEDLGPVGEGDIPEGTKTGVANRSDPIFESADPVNSKKFRTVIAKSKRRNPRQWNTWIKDREYLLCGRINSGYIQCAHFCKGNLTEIGANYCNIRRTFTKS